VFGPRNIYAYEDAVMIYTAYSKTNWRLNKTNPIARFVTPRLGAHLLATAMIGIPMMAGILGDILEKPVDQKRYQEYRLWTDHRLNALPSTTITDQLKRWSTEAGLPVLNVRKFRHLIIAFSKRYMDCSLDDVRASGSLIVDQLFDQQGTQGD
jgi:hypothetical protein